MPIQYTPYSVPLVAAAGLAFVSAVLAWRKNDRADVRWYAATMVAIGSWAVLLLLVVSSVSITAKLVWYSLLLPTAVALAMAWFVFAAIHTGHGGLVSRRRIGFAAASLLVYLGAGLTNASHELVFVDPAVDTSGSFALLTYEWGPVVWGYTLAAYLFLVGGTALLFRKFLHSRNVYRKLALSLTLCGLLLWLANVATFAGLSPVPHMMLLPLTFLFVGVVSIVFITSVRAVKLIPLDRVLSPLGGRFSSLLPLARDFVVEELDSGVVVLDADDRIVDINPAGKRMLGEGRQPVGRRIDDIVDVDEVLSNVSDSDDLTDVRTEEWVDTDDGERCYDITISALGDAAGDLAGRVVLVHDITTQKLREEALEQRERELRERTASLRKQTQKLEHQNERLDEFAAMVSHDLRNPLTIASSYLELIDEEDDATAEYLETVRDANTRMMDIIDDALTLAREGRAITDTQPVAVATAAREAWRTVETRTATLEVRTDRVIDADADRLRTVFENLFRNAVEHAGDHPTVTVGAMDDGFYVADDGPGIPPADRTQVMGRGYTTREAGTGLGLAIVRDAVRAHGWTIEVTDSEAGGARFEIRSGQPVDRAVVASTSPDSPDSGTADSAGLVSDR